MEFAVMNRMSEELGDRDPIFIGEILHQYLRHINCQNILTINSGNQIRSSTESEYRALVHVAAEISWIESLLTELQFPFSSPSVTWCDNLSASALAANPVFHARTKHIEIDAHYVRDKVLQRQLEVRYIPSHDQIADCLTKGLSPSRFTFLVNKLGVRHPPLRLIGDVKE
ncbi:hypothetical protein CsatA_003472 [Cannabis sativa]